MAAETAAVVNSDVPVAEEQLKQQPRTPASPAVVVEEKKKKKTLNEDVADDATKPEAEKRKIEETDVVAQSEETNVAGDLPDLQKKALDELKVLVHDALSKHEFVTDPTPPLAAEESEPKPPAAADPPKDQTKEEDEPVKDLPSPPLPASVVDEEKSKSEEEAAKPESTTEAEATTVVVIEAAVDEDGAKTVEAIEETIVSISAPTEPEPETTTATATETPPPATPVTPEEVSIWGIPLLSDERSDVILLKFLRARDFKVKEAFTMLRNTVRWRNEFKIDELLTHNFTNTSEFNKVVFMNGFDKQGHPVCYNVYSEFQNKDLYNNALADEEKRLNFLKWRIQFLEKSIRKLDFSPGGVNTIVQVNDLKNSPGPTKKELRLATNQALQLLQDNYPEFVAKQVFINVPWWYLAFNRMMSPFLTQRTKSKFVFAGPSRSADTLFKYIAPEQVPIQYGGLSTDQEEAFTAADAVTEVVIKPASKHTIEFPFTESGLLTWELRVVGWEVTYGAEFVPAAEDSYTVIVQKSRKISPSDEQVISDTFKVGEPGKVIVTIDNQTSKKKKLVYRSKTKPLSE